MSFVLVVAQTIVYPPRIHEILTTVKEGFKNRFSKAICLNIPGLIIQKGLFNETYLSVKLYNGTHITNDPREDKC